MTLTQPIGFIGAGKVACSMGKYLKETGFPVIGYYSRTRESALAAAQFTDSGCYSSLEELVNASDTLFIAAGDTQIPLIWDRIAAANPDHVTLHSKIICHFSGSLSSDVFHLPGTCSIHPASVHPMLAFPDKFHSWKQLSDAFLTMEGDETALAYFSQMFQKTKNRTAVISADKKPLYHTAASLISNQVDALLDIGLSLFMDCGFSKENAYIACAPLIQGNVENILANDTVLALTGPIERNDVSTVETHLNSLSGDTRQLYCLLGKRLVAISRQKHPDTDFSEMMGLLENSPA